MGGILLYCRKPHGGDSPQRRKLDQKKVSLATLCHPRFWHANSPMHRQDVCKKWAWHKVAKLTLFWSNLRLCGESSPWGRKRRVYLPLEKGDPMFSLQMCEEDHSWAAGTVAHALVHQYPVHMCKHTLALCRCRPQSC